MIPWRAIFPYVMPAVVFALEWKLLSPSPALADHFQFWAAGNIVVTGRSPYDRAAWEAMAALGPLPSGVAMSTVAQDLALTRYFWLYPPQTAFLLAPFGALPLEVGIPLLHLFVLAASCAGAVMAARATGLAGWRLALALVAVAISQPFVIAVRDGHPVGLVLAGVAACYVGARDRRALPLAIGLVCVSVKPHIAIAFLAGAFAYLVVRRAWRPVAIGLVALAAVTIPAEIATPFPTSVLTGATQERVGLDNSNVGALSRDLGDGLALTVTLVSLAGAAGFAAVAAAGERKPLVGWAAVAAASLVIAPYAHDYDQLLTFPAAFVGISVARGTRREPVFVAVFAALIAVMTWILFFWWPLVGRADRADQAGMIGALPILALFALAVASRASRVIRRGGEGRGAARAAPYATSR